MNYLAHAFLSGLDDEILIGNFIGDYVKGRNFKHFSPGIQQGIKVHRRIDSFTDQHKIVSQSKQYLISKYKKYAGIVIDIFYDHFLIKNWDKYCPISLDDFKSNLFEVLQRNHAAMPERVQFFIPSFIKNDWIETYSSQEGIIEVLYRLSMRTTLPDESEFAREILHKYYIQLDSEFLTFFPELIRYIVNKFKLTIPLTDNKLLGNLL